MTLTITILLLALSCVMLLKGADWLVTGATGIAYRWGIPYIIVGLTFVAMGTSMPELAVSIISELKGSADIAVGNIIGSNILNIWLILGISSVAAVVAVNKTNLKFEIPLVIISAVLLFFLGRDGRISLVDGIILLAVFAAYFINLLVGARLSKQTVKRNKVRNYPMWQNVVFTVVGAVLIIAGSLLAVKEASNLARAAGMSERFIGLTIVAFGTSLPELFTSVVAARQGNSELAIGNIVGSNIFNILFVIGLAAVIVPLPFNVNFRVDTVIAAFAGIVLLIFALKKKLGKPAGFTMLALYAVYLGYLIKTL